MGVVTSRITNVLARWSGGTIAPVIGSGSCPTWIARVRKCMPTSFPRSVSVQKGPGLSPRPRQRLIQIGNQIGRVLNAQSQPDHVVGDPEFQPLGG